MSEPHKTKAKSFADEMRRMPIEYQRRVKWTLRIAVVWASTVVVGAGAFILSKPYMDRRREEKIKSGEFFKELRENEKGFAHMQRSFDRPNSIQDQELAPPPYLLDVIGDIMKEEEGKKKQPS